MFTCSTCGNKIIDIDAYYTHIEREHMGLVPKNFSVSQYVHFLKTGRDHGICRVCKKPTKWNESTKKYNTFCENIKCKDTYRKLFEQRMIGKYGKITLLNEPDHQKKMLSHRKISGEYKWSDEDIKISYTGSYELDFLKLLDVLLNFDPRDIMAPSPHTYYYNYEGEKKFYIPDFFIPSLNLEIEIKDGGSNPNKHNKIQAVDKVKEKLKDEVMMSQKTFNYIKITNKNYEPLFEFLLRAKEQFNDIKENKPGEPIFILGESFTPEEEYFKNIKNIYYGLTEKEAKEKKLDYTARKNFNGKGVNTTLTGLIKFIEDNRLQDTIKYYTKIDPKKFSINKSILPDIKYDMIVVNTPFSIEINDIKKINYSVKESFIILESQNNPEYGKCGFCGISRSFSDKGECCPNCENKILIESTDLSCHGQLEQKELVSPGLYNYHGMHNFIHIYIYPNSSDEMIKTKLMSLYQTIKQSNTTLTYLIKVLEQIKEDFLSSDETAEHVTWLSTEFIPLLKKTFSENLIQQSLDNNYEEIIYKLWRIIDDIDTVSDIAKGNDSWYRHRVEELQRKRWDVLDEKTVDEIYNKFYNKINF